MTGAFILSENEYAEIFLQWFKTAYCLLFLLELKLEQHKNTGLKAQQQEMTVFFSALHFIFSQQINSSILNF